jgi:2-dehydropantoate 2-reductase
MQRDGLVLDSQLGALTVKPVRAVATPAEAGGPVDVVIFATKLGDTESAAKSLEPVIGSETIVITFQNGVDGPEIIASALPGVHVVTGVVRIASHIPRPGVIEQRGGFADMEFGETDGSASPKLEAFHAACKAAGINAILTPHIRRVVWEKFGFLAPFSGITTLTGHTAGPLRENPVTRKLLEDAVREVVAVGRAAGVDLRPDEVERRMRGLDTLPPAMTSSMSHDRRAGKPLELDYLSGGVVRLGEKLGVPTPTHAFITRALALDAGGKR